MAWSQPDPFLLAAKELGYPAENCVVFEDSPSGIKAGVASGAKTVAVCTSHPHEKSAFPPPLPPFSPLLFLPKGEQELTALL